MNHLNIISLNCRGLRDRSKRLAIYNWFKKQKADILFIHESHFTTDTVLLGCMTYMTGMVHHFILMVHLPVEV